LKGHKDKDGNFHPHTHSSGLKSHQVLNKEDEEPTHAQMDAEHYQSMRELNKQSPTKCKRCGHGTLCHDGHICLAEGCTCEGKPLT